VVIAKERSIPSQPFLERDIDFFFFRLPNGLGTALLGTVSTFLTASRKRANASGPSIISRVWAFMSFIIPYSIRIVYLGN